MNTLVGCTSAKAFPLPEKKELRQRYKRKCKIQKKSATVNLYFKGKPNIVVFAFFVLKNCPYAG